MLYRTIFVKPLSTCAYKKARQSRQQLVRIQTSLCEVACEQNSCSLKISIVKIYRTVASALEDRSAKKFNEQVVIAV